MRKQEFLQELRDGLAGLPQNEIEKRVAFYAEMIDDRVEEGLSEEEAVAAVGTVYEIVLQAAEEFPEQVSVRIKPKRKLSAMAIVLLILGSPVWFSLLIAAAVWLVFTLMGGFLEGLVFASPFILCGLVCVIFKKNVGLWCAWTVFCTVNMYLRYATGITWRLTLFSLHYEPSMNYMRLAFAWLEVACVVALLVVTAVRVGKTPLAVCKKNIAIVIALWVLFGLTWIRLSIDPLSLWGNLYYYLSDWVQFIVSAVTLTNTVRLIRGWKQKK